MQTGDTGLESNTKTEGDYELTLRASSQHCIKKTIAMRAKCNYLCVVRSAKFQARDPEK